MKKNILLPLFLLMFSVSFSQLNYTQMKDTICPSLCGIKDSLFVKEIYSKLLNLDTAQISTGLADYYEDLSHVQYDLCLWNNEDSTLMRLSLQNTERSLYYDPNRIGMLWNAAFGYTVFKDCEKVSYYLQRFKKACPRRYLKGYKDQLTILLQMCPNEDLKKEFRIK